MRRRWLGQAAAAAICEDGGSGRREARCGSGVAGRGPVLRYLRRERRRKAWRSGMGGEVVETVTAAAAC